MDRVSRVHLLVVMLLATTASAVAVDAPAALADQSRILRPQAADGADDVDPFVGTRPPGPEIGHSGEAGNTFPGADAPFGMLQWSPDTVNQTIGVGGGYHYDDNRIRGFSLTHLSGPGCPAFGNVPFLPVPGSSPASHYTFSHSNESASPGYYSVTFDNGVRTELTATTRAGMARFGYPAGQRASLLVDAAKAFDSATGTITIGTDTLSGYSESGGFCGAGNRYRVYFHAVFDRPFATAGVVGPDGRVDRSRRSIAGSSKVTRPAPNKTGVRRSPTRTSPAGSEALPAAAAFVSFDAATVIARVGISFVSIEGARANAATELGDRTFDAVRTGTRAAWNDWLGLIAVSGGIPAERRIFYTNLYHSLLHPNVFSDTDGRYRGFDGQVHTVPPGRTQYANFSGWDVYRSQVQLVALLDPGIAADIARSAVDQAAQSGFFDRWTLANGTTGVMTGDPVPIMISSMYAFGATGFDAADALRRMVAGSNHPRQRTGVGHYNTYGYVPVAAPGVWGSVSTTLEHAVADLAISQLAGRLGDSQNHELFLRKAQNWRNLFHPISRYVQPRNLDTTFPPFSPNQQSEYVEGNGEQYTWFVPHNYRGLFDAMGGNGAVRSRLDQFFSRFNAGPGQPYAWLGNEPTLNVPWAYVYAGAPHRSQDVVRRALTALYRLRPDGYPGNDDLGQTASWGVWAALGMYPQVPGRAELILASPRFSGISITRRNGVTIDISAPNASDSMKYVQGLTVNGSPSNRAWLPESFVSTGGSLVYTLGTEANESWGSSAADAPPSFDVGPATPRTGRITGIAGKCADVDRSGVADGTRVQIWDCNGTAAQQWTLASDGTVRALGKCLDVHYSGRENFTKIELWACNGTGAQQWWPRPGGALLNPASGRCLDVPLSNPANGNQLQIFDCNGTVAQIWTLPQS